MSNISTKRILKVKFKLLELMTFKENLTQRLLASSVGLSLGHTNKVLDELALDGYINIIKDTENGKRFLYQLTPEGEKYMIELGKQLMDIYVEEYLLSKFHYEALLITLSKHDKNFKLDNVVKDMVHDWLYKSLEEERRLRH